MMVFGKKSNNCTFCHKNLDPDPYWIQIQQQGLDPDPKHWLLSADSSLDCCINRIRIRNAGCLCRFTIGLLYKQRKLVPLQRKFPPSTPPTASDNGQGSPSVRGWTLFKYYFLMFRGVNSTVVPNPVTVAVVSSSGQMKWTQVMKVEIPK
jgi:hypothetical protein